MLLIVAKIIGIVVGVIVGVVIFKNIFDATLLAVKLHNFNREVKNVNSALDKYVEELKI